MRAFRVFSYLAVIYGFLSVSAFATSEADVGRMLFFDATLSASGTLACATCHDPFYAYGPPPGRALAMGGKTMALPGTRAVPSLRYLQSSPMFSLVHRFIDGDVGPVGGFTWDGRANSLREQASFPLMAPNEMANANIATVVSKVRRAPYAGEFKRIYGDSIFDGTDRAFDALVRALQAFQSIPEEFSPFSSRYDAYLRGEVELSDAEERGVALFKDPSKGNCASCHLSSSRNGNMPIFTDFDYANVGVPRNPKIAANGDARYFDLGLCGPDRRDLGGQQKYCGMFRAPTLRNVAVRDAFFHNGAFTTLREATKFYIERDLKPENYYSRNADGSVHKTDDMPAGAPDNLDHDAPLDRLPGSKPALTDAEIDDVIAFLNTLTDADVRR